MKNASLLAPALIFLMASPGWGQKRVKFPPGRTSVTLKGRTTGGPSESGGINPVAYGLRARQ
ncbi:MAG: hypothetical protein CFK52_08025 [Chloracidobacterium sp. CP2_5A]|nr:MAG: hypothetical protein CFK52_08025 [Chloracidobacterium sp. CP2_5A]